MTTFTDKELIKEIKERISSLDVRDDICVTVSSNSDSLAADARLFFVAVVMGMFPSIKKRQRRWLAYAVIMSVRED